MLEQGHKYGGGVPGGAVKVWMLGAEKPSMHPRPATCKRWAPLVHSS